MPSWSSGKPPGRVAIRRKGRVVLRVPDRDEQRGKRPDAQEQAVAKHLPEPGSPRGRLTRPAKCRREQQDRDEREEGDAVEDVDQLKRLWRRLLHERGGDQAPDAEPEVEQRMVHGERARALLRPHDRREQRILRRPDDRRTQADDRRRSERVPRLAHGGDCEGARGRDDKPGRYRVARPEPIGKPAAERVTDEPGDRERGDGERRHLQLEAAYLVQVDEQERERQAGPERGQRTSRRAGSTPRAEARGRDPSPHAYAASPADRRSAGGRASRCGSPR